ncbi:ArdC-like ssDNA-binding domain-containing protein [Enterococcus faecium]|nr:ArdC-like ssDNA-binding domain-containing protein [Enterococcus faecium]MCU1983117.1 ArdC-like ssDNA-binding domain-containing protein [Enterococcus faecium]MCU1994295.1 ArdC-like ssDNA-binding domain-containing protein [Enterococcus faecium]
MAEEKEPLDNSRLGKSKRKLVRLQNELNEQIEKMVEHQRKTNGQPMNDKRNGRSWFRQQERIENKVHSLREEIKQQEKQVEKLERQEELKEMGYNKYGGLDMTIENIPRIREEIERFEKGESSFSAATIRKYQRKLETLEQLKEKSEKGKENILPEVQAIIDSGRVTQWKKNPTIYFLKGYRKVALELNENGEFEESKKYQATSEEEKAAIRELLEEAAPTDSLKEKETDHFYRVEFNENDPEKGLKSYGGEIVTFELIDQLKTLDNQYAAEAGYYKFYFEEVKNGEVVDQIRMDLGDGVNSNQPIYLELAKLCEQVPEKEQKQTVKNEPITKEQMQSKETKTKQKGYQKRTAEEIKQEVKSLSQQALDAVKKHTHSPEDVKELLNFMSRFPERSFRNQLLIEEQFPGATACLGRAALKKEGIYIKKGEQGNKIFVRKTVKGFYEKGRGFVRETEATPEDKKRIESGQIEVIKKPYYTIEKVFDITQTQLKPEDYPKIFPNRVFDFQLDTKGQSELQAGIQAVANNIGIQIRDMSESEIYQRELGQARGAYVRNEFTGEEEIVMNTRNTPTQHLATSIHELAHARMHKFSELDTATKELQAEMTSYIVCKHFGMDTSEKAIPYIAAWTKNGQTLDDKEAAERGKIMNDVSRVANEFIQTISTEINQYREKEYDQEKKRPQSGNIELDNATKELQKQAGVVVSTYRHWFSDHEETRPILIKEFEKLLTVYKENQQVLTKENLGEKKEALAITEQLNHYDNHSSEDALYVVSDNISQYYFRNRMEVPVFEKLKDRSEIEKEKIVKIGTLWIDKKDGKVMEENTGRTLHLKEAAFIEDPQHNQVILKGKSYGKEIQTALSSEEFALGNPFRFSLETVSEVAKRKNEIYYEQQLSQKERV